MLRILVVAALALQALTPRAEQQGGGRTAERLLEIDAVAFDRNGEPITDLRAEDLDVWIAGYRVPIESVVAVTPATDERTGRSTIVLLDDITLPHSLIPEVRRAARRFVSRMAPGDQLAITGLSDEAMKLTTDAATLLRRVDRYNVRATGVMRVEDLAAHVLSTITSLARQLAEAPGGRKTIVAIGSGGLFDRPIPPAALGRDLQPEWVAAMRALAFAKANLYVIDPGGVGTSIATGGSSGFAAETGGFAFLNTNDVTGAVDRILRDASTYYLIRVADPPAHRKAALREVEVRVLRRGITVRARRGIPGTQ